MDKKSNGSAIIYELAELLDESAQQALVDQITRIREAGFGHVSIVIQNHQVRFIRSEASQKVG